MEDSFEYNNEDEGEMGQLHSIHVHLNAIAVVRSKLRTGPSLEECEECGDDIPQARQLAVQGCSKCITCQEIAEKKK